MKKFMRYLEFDFCYISAYITNELFFRIMSNNTFQSFCMFYFPLLCQQDLFSFLEFNFISKIKMNSKPFVQLQVVVIVQYLERFLFSIQKFDAAFYVYFRSLRHLLSRKVLSHSRTLRINHSYYHLHRQMTLHHSFLVALQRHLVELRQEHHLEKIIFD